MYLTKHRHSVLVHYAGRRGEIVEHDREYVHAYELSLAIQIAYIYYHFI